MWRCASAWRNNSIQLVSNNDIAIYGGICALAILDRESLLSSCLENAEFKQFLELEPNIRDAMSHLYCGRLSVSLSLLSQVKVG